MFSTVPCHRFCCQVLSLCSWSHYSVVGLRPAETTGFEPATRLTPDNCFPSNRFQPLSHVSIIFLSSGSGRIRTHERLKPFSTFEADAFSHSATLPKYSRQPVSRLPTRGSFGLSIPQLKDKPSLLRVRSSFLDAKCQQILQNLSG